MAATRFHADADRRQGRRGRRPAVRRAALVLLLPLMSAWAPARADVTPALRVCVDADHPPFSSSSTPTQGFDVDLAAALAQRLQRTPQLVWVDVPNRGGLPKAMREQLDGGHCDVFTAVPAGGDEALPPRWRQSPPYAVLRYRWAAAAGQPAPSDPPARSRPIGVVSATPADLYLHTHGLPRTPYPNNTALLAALASGEVPAVLVWSAALAQASPAPVVAPRGPDDPTLRTALTLVTRSRDAALGDALGTALAALQADGTLDTLARRHGLPADLSSLSR